MGINQTYTCDATGKPIDQENVSFGREDNDGHFGPAVTFKLELQGKPARVVTADILGPDGLAAGQLVMDRLEKSEMRKPIKPKAKPIAKATDKVPGKKTGKKV